jgi:hypothetical protein
MNAVDTISSVTSVDIFNMNGALIKEEKVQNTGSVKLSIAGYPAGMYLVRIHHGDSMSFSRLIKQD